MNKITNWTVNKLSNHNMTKMNYITLPRMPYKRDYLSQQQYIKVIPTIWEPFGQVKCKTGKSPNTIDSICYWNKTHTHTRACVHIQCPWNKF